MDNSLKYTLFFDNCDNDAIERLKTVFNYDPQLSGVFIDNETIISNLFSLDELVLLNEEWVVENLGTKDFQAQIDEINEISEKVVVTLVSNTDCLPFIKSLMRDVTTSYCSDVFLSGDFHSFDYTIAGCVVGEKDEIVSHPLDTSSFVIEDLTEGSIALESYMESLLQHRSTKFSEFLNSLPTP